MAPRPPTKAAAHRKPSRSSTSARRISRPARPSAAAEPSPFDNDDDNDTPFTSTKKDRQRIKHSLLISRLKPNAAGRSGVQKRRSRTVKSQKQKLVTDLDALASVLPDISELPVTADEKAVAERHSSAKSKPGSRKKREEMLKKEKKQMEVNMAILSANGPPMRDQGQAEAVDGRWSALRKALQSNLGVQQNEEMTT